MTGSTFLFSTVAAMASCHPQAQAIRCSRPLLTDPPQIAVVLSSHRLTSRQQLEVDMALLSQQLSDVVTADLMEFCHRIDALFQAHQPRSNLERIVDIDWPRVERMMTYARYWQTSQPKAVARLKQLLMEIPLYNTLLAELIHHSAQQKAMLSVIAEPDVVYMMGIRQFQQCYQQEIQHALMAAKQVVATYCVEHQKPSFLSHRLQYEQS